MKRIIVALLLLSGCSSNRIPPYLYVAWEVTYGNNVRERIMVHQHCRLDKSGCFMDKRKAIRCDVRSARRIPLHQVDKDGVMYELD